MKTAPKPLDSQLAVFFVVGRPWRVGLQAIAWPSIERLARERTDGWIDWRLFVPRSFQSVARVIIAYATGGVSLKLTVIVAAFTRKGPQLRAKRIATRQVTR